MFILFIFTNQTKSLKVDTSSPGVSNGSRLWIKFR